jgi:hypothetical protein
VKDLDFAAQEIANNAIVAFIASLARDNVPPHIQELLIYGDYDKVKPKALTRAIAAALSEISKGEKVFNGTHSHTQNGGA